MKNSILFLLLISLLQFSFSQEMIADSSLLKENKEKIDKNIILGLSLKEVGDDTYIDDEFYYESNHKLRLKIVKLDTLIFPIPNFQLYKIIYSGSYTFVARDGVLLTAVKVGSSYSYSVFLVAVAKNQKESILPILFISGNFPLSFISKYFKLDEENMDTFNSYIKIKLFDYDLTNIKYRRKNKNYIYFKAFSIKLQKNIKLKIHKFNYDFIDLK